MKKTETFDEWFAAQFGKRPSNESVTDLRGKMVARQYLLGVAEKTLLAVEFWEDRRDAARKAYNAFTNEQKRAAGFRLVPLKKAKKARKR